MRQTILLLALLLAVPGEAARTRIVGPRAAGPVFNRDVAVIPAGGWGVSYIVGDEPPSSLTWTLTVRTWADGQAPWHDVQWRATNPRLVNGVFEVPVYRVRVSASRATYCRVAMLAIPASPNQEVQHRIDASSFRSEDLIFFEGWKGYSQSLDIRDLSGEIRFTGAINLLYSTPPVGWPPQHENFLGWTQAHSVMGCE